MKKRVKWLLILGGAVALLAAVAVTVFMVWYRGDVQRAAKDLPKQVARARALGLPLEPRELRRDPPVKASENAAPAIRTLVSILKAGSPVYRASTRIFAADINHPEATADQDWKTVAPALALARRAAAKPHCDFDYDWNQGFSLQVPEYPPSKASAKLLAWHGVKLARENRTDEALAEFWATREVGRLIGETPGSIPLLVSVAVDGLALKGYVGAAKVWKADLDALRRLRKELDRAVPTPAFKGVVDVEVVLDVVTVRKMEKQVVQGGAAKRKEATPSPGTRRRARAWMDAYLARCLAYWCDVEEASKGQAVGPALAKKLDKLSDAQDGHRTPSYLLSVVVSMPVGSLVNALTAYLARQCTARGFVDVLLFRSIHGRLPKDLAEAGSREADPFDGRPLRYKVEGQGFVVYSVGKDGKDDGGAIEKAPGAEAALDLGFRWSPTKEGVERAR